METGPRTARNPSTDPLVEVVVPVHQEERTLERNVLMLAGYLTSRFPFRWRIVIADNASRDATPEIGARLSREVEGVRPLRLDGGCAGRSGAARGASRPRSCRR